MPNQTLTERVDSLEDRFYEFLNKDYEGLLQRIRQGESVVRKMKSGAVPKKSKKVSVGVPDEFIQLNKRIEAIADDLKSLRTQIKEMQPSTHELDIAELQRRVSQLEFMGTPLKIG